MSNLLKRRLSHLLIVDVQEKLLPPIQNSDELVGCCRRSIEIARHLNIGITLSEHYKKGLGETPLPILDAVKQDELFEKAHFSCVGNESLRERFLSLKQKGVSQIVICGSKLISAFFRLQLS